MGNKAGEKREAQLLAFIANLKHNPSSNSLDKTERTLAALLRARLNRAEEHPEFMERLKLVGWKTREEQIAESEAEAVTFYDVNGRWPSHGAKDPSERRLAATMRIRIKKNPEFEATVKQKSWRKGIRVDMRSFEPKKPPPNRTATSSCFVRMRDQDRATIEAAIAKLLENVSMDGAKFSIGAFMVRAALEKAERILKGDK